MAKVIDSSRVRRYFRMAAIACCFLFLFHLVFLVSGGETALYNLYPNDTDTARTIVEGPFLLGLMACLFYILDLIKLRSAGAVDTHISYKLLVYVTGFLFLAGVVLWVMGSSAATTPL
jgi:hypothetical protein